MLVQWYLWQWNKTFIYTFVTQNDIRNKRFVTILMNHLSWSTLRSLLAFNVQSKNAELSLSFEGPVKNATIVIYLFLWVISNRNVGNILWYFCQKKHLYCQIPIYMCMHHQNYTNAHFKKISLKVLLLHSSWRKKTYSNRYLHAPTILEVDNYQTF